MRVQVDRKLYDSTLQEQLPQQWFATFSVHSGNKMGRDANQRQKAQYFRPKGKKEIYLAAHFFVAKLIILVPYLVYIF